MALADGVAAVLMAVGAGWTLLGVLGMIRFPDVITRLHGTGLGVYGRDCAAVGGGGGPLRHAVGYSERAGGADDDFRAADVSTGEHGYSVGGTPDEGGRR